MKNIFKTLFISSALILSAGCVKETFPKGGTITKEQLEGSGNHLQYMLSGIPAAMMNPGTAGYASSFHGDFGIPAIHFATETMLEDLTFLGELGYSHFRYWHQNLGQGADYLYCTFFWKLYYKWIHLANEIIALVGKVDEETTDEERQALGQAYAYRAMFYLDLARMYEAKPCSIQTPPESILGLTVPIVDEHTTETQAQKNKRAKREDMYQFIISDLDKAEALLKGSTYVYTKPTTAAVYGLKARTYLELGASYAEFGDPKAEVWDMTSQKAYELAAEYARKVIDLNLHSPLTQAQWEDASTGFNDGTSNSAWIWGLTVSVENISNLISNIAHRSPEALYGYAVWNQLGVNQALYNQISDEDFRKHSWYDPELNYRYQLAGAAEVQGNYFVYNSTYA